MRNGRVGLWAVWLVVAAVAALCLPLAPGNTLPTKIYGNAVGVSAVLMACAGVLRNRPEHRGPWLMLVAGMALLVAGDVTYDVTELRLGEYPYPHWADALYLCAYPLLLIPGMVRLSRGNGDRDRGGLIDAAVISTGVGLIYYVFVVGPALTTAGTPLPERFVTIGYPLCDVMLTAAVARMLTRPENRTPSLRLLGLGSIIMLAGDLVYTTMSATAEYSGGIIDSAFLLAYVCWAAAALHPSMRRRPRTGIDPHRVGSRRLAVLAACSLLAPGLLVLQGVQDPRNIAWAGIGAGAVTLFLLVIARSWGFVKQVQRQAGRLEDLAMHDELTGLSNRRGFERRLTGALATGSPYVLLLDLNGFKSVNDRFGHAVGDELLVVIAHRLAAALPAEAVVSRMGGDEFAVLLPAHAADRPGGARRCEGVAERLDTATRLPVRAGGQDLLVGASIGIADGAGLTDPVEVLRRADVAMYAAKAGGGRHHWYTVELDTRAGEEARLGADLRIALDAGQFHLVYQPVVNLPDGTVRAVESLVRWQHPERGAVSPAEFIPVAERTGLITELGRWILRTACEQYRAWQDRGVAPRHIGVNVSARQLAEPGFAAAVAAVLAETGMDPRRLVVEITETAVFGGGVAARAVHDLHALGISIALDDFGTGHSSLGVLQALPVDILKVDKSFVENVTVSDRHAVIAASLIQLTEGLGLIAVAEGVETPAQAAALHRLGYRRAQGYHFGRPAADPFAPVSAAAA
ncbi:putative bifunctional diguanylate cyclase/phosphodiesterase [Actinoplanes teichomyceticus]|uniref:putative bifunctional diguanylate cyclase/phosphodiesterase n=1 Tax=Actinoplanes teichomyceticus TaxID=1867 RepID=UPI001A43FF12|nr:EAL domain-containing protein [Actinoplanes teichomyceticus]GIF14041.1 bifunctional diguanylate cyclase/phosphodiesterase [Actinoplanes teichomyceticus]